MVATRSVAVIILSCMSWFYSSSGRTTSDGEQDVGVKWPVLCPPDTFYSLKQELCLTCSGCPINKIITSPCHEFQDTKCGPFYDFQSAFPADDATAHKTGDHIPANNNNAENTGNTKISSNNSMKEHDNLKSRINQKGTAEKDSSDVPDYLDNSEYSDSEWKSLTIALIVLVSIFFIIVIICAVFFLRRRIINEKQISCEYSSPPEIV